MTPSGIVNVTTKGSSGSPAAGADVTGVLVLLLELLGLLGDVELDVELVVGELVDVVLDDALTDVVVADSGAANAGAGRAPTAVDATPTAPIAIRPVNAIVNRPR